jgi:hypothetical protein
MRNLLQIILAAVVLVANRGYSAVDTESATLAFYIVSDDKIDGGRFIDTLDFPKIGYIAAQPDLVVTQLVAVSESSVRFQSGEVGKDGKEKDTPWRDAPALLVLILPADAQKFESLTERNVGKRVLMMLGKTPLIAPWINMPITTQSFEIRLGDDGNKKAIEDALKRLVH